MNTRKTTQEKAERRQVWIKLPPVFSSENKSSLYIFHRPTLAIIKPSMIYLLAILLMMIPVKFTTRAAGNNANTASPSGMRKLDCAVMRYEDGKVVLKWNTANAADNLGFNIYREDKKGNRIKLNSAVIGGAGLLAKAGSPLVPEQTFSWFDNRDGANRKSLYFIEDLDFSGQKTLYGPFTVGTAKGNAPTVAKINSSAGEETAIWQTSYPADSQSAYSSLNQQSQTLAASALQSSAKASGEEYAMSQASGQFELAGNGQAIKLGVRHEGWYRVSYAELRGAGLTATVNPRRLKLMVNGVEQAMLVNGEGDGRFDAGDSIEFYGAGIDTLATDEQVYWLAEGQSLGKRITASKATGTGASVTGYSCTMERRDRSIYFSGLLNGDENNYFGAIVLSDGVDQAVEVKRVDRTAASTPVALEVMLQGVTETYHRVSVTLNGQYLGETEFFGKTASSFRAEVSQALLVEGNNNVRLTSLNGGSDISLVDCIRVNYPHQYTTDDNRLMMSATDGSALKIGGFSEGRIRVMDICDPQKVQELQGDIVQDGNGYAVKLMVKQRGLHKLLAFTDSQVQLVDEVKANQPSSWNAKTNEADLVVLTHEKLASAVTPLVNLRRSQGYQVAVVNVEDAYDEYGYGVKSVGALRELLRQTQNWRLAPHYVLAVGDASVDPRHFVWQADTDLVPSKMVGTFFMECPSDDWMVDFNNDYLPELALGRLPAKSEAEAQLLVQKIVAYEQNAGSQMPIKSILLVSDANDDYDFETYNDDLIPLLPSETQVGKVYRGQLGTEAAKSQLMAAINQGQSIVNYKGHGSNGLWRGNLLTTGDGAAMTNAQNLSFFISMTCLNSMYVMPDSECLSSDLLKAPNGGAIAVWSSSALTYPDAQNLMNAEILRLLSNSRYPITIGEAARLAKGATTDSDSRQSWILLGDPLCHVK